MTSQEVGVPTGTATVTGDLVVPEDARGVVLFAHGTGSSRHSPRNRAVAGELQEAGLATLLLDLLTEEEERADMASGQFRFDIGLLGRRLVAAVDCLAGRPETAELPLSLFGASTGAAAALVAAAESPHRVRSVVSRGGRPDLAGDALHRVTAPVLLIVGGDDVAVLGMNREAAESLRAPRVRVVSGATHLFEEPGALDEVAAAARDWFLEHGGQAPGGAGA